MRRVSMAAWLFASVLAAGCARTEAPGPLDPAGAKFLLADEPAGAKGVLAAREAWKDGDEVIVLGRIGGSTQPFSGRAAFTIVDPSLKPCNEKGDDKCETPWDYCCDDAKDIARASAFVKFVDGSGQTLPQDARQLLGVKELQTVVVRGRAKRDGDNLTVLADGVHVRK